MLDPPEGLVGPSSGPTGVPPLLALLEVGGPVVGPATVDPVDASVDVVVGGGSVDPWVTSVVVVLWTVDVVVGGGSVDPWVTSVVVVVLPVDPHGPISDTEVDALAVNPSLQRACTLSVTFPVTLPGTTVVADVVSDAPPTGPTVAW